MTYQYQRKPGCTKLSVVGLRKRLDPWRADMLERAAAALRADAAWLADVRLCATRARPAPTCPRRTPGDKASLRRLVNGSQLHTFAKAAYSRGHAATNSSRWLDERAPYEVPYVINYEPWFIISRRRSPPYDVRFCGYGWNKVAQVALVAASNFTFRVHPAAWLVHRPHERSRGQDLYSGPAAGVGGSGRAAQEEVRSPGPTGGRCAGPARGRFVGPAAAASACARGVGARPALPIGTLPGCSAAHNANLSRSRGGS
ncbi:Glycosyltransferase-like protein LARGE2 [Tetrabaena socialis]|uniref:Glycosyltransferase-like protein LARGE2 n=1 Tax=Tetrabaena socialis TaxID=47790 RepID=A0A2J7ZU47_9CHLO|nr:Glycosyltransferase-like protein LARGE2 [Tetrabaena socialis]|eukprot:PNH03794.1 Glycosyltransferase-like protein LARGE2 [Tetrabaena socialis]